jgi:hypothetical protein
MFREGTPTSLGSRLLDEFQRKEPSTTIMISIRMSTRCHLHHTHHNHHLLSDLRFPVTERSRLLQTRGPVNAKHMKVVGATQPSSGLMQINPSITNLFFCARFFPPSLPSKSYHSGSISVHLVVSHIPCSHGSIDKLVRFFNSLLRFLGESTLC